MRPNTFAAPLGTDASGRLPLNIHNNFVEPFDFYQAGPSNAKSSASTAPK
jgi:hypothetical protein